MLVFLQLLYAAPLEPQKIQGYDCAKVGDVVTLQIKHDDPSYYFDIAVESLNGASIEGSVTDSKNKVKQVRINMRAALTGFAVGVSDVKLTCTAIGKIYVSYFDGYLLLQNAKLSTTVHKLNDIYVLVPICTNDKIQVKTNAKVRASYTTARPDDAAEYGNKDTLADFEIPDVTIPGYLFLYFSFPTGAAEGFLTVTQQEVTEIQYNVEYQHTLSAQTHCYSHYTMTMIKGDHFFAAAADQDLQMKRSVPTIFFQTHFSTTDIADATNYDYTSGTGLLDLDPAQKPEPYDQATPSAVAISIGLNVAFLPMRHKVSANFTEYKYSVFFTVTGSGLFPGYAEDITIPDGAVDHDTVIVFKNTDQFRYTDPDMDRIKYRYSSYVVQVSSAQMTTQYQQLTFGYGQPAANQGVVTKLSDTTYQGIVEYDPQHDVPVGELFYVKMLRNTQAGKFTGQIKAQNSFLLQNRISYTYRPIDQQVDKYFYGHFNPSENLGMEIQITKNTVPLTIYTHQTIHLPYAGVGGFENKHFCEANQACTFILEPEQIDKSKPVFLSFQTDATFNIIAGPKDMVMQELAPFQQVTGKLVLKDDNPKNLIKQAKYYFSPQWKTYDGTVKQDEDVVITIAADAEETKKLIDYDMDLLVLVGTSPDPQIMDALATISLASGIYEIGDDVSAAKKHQTLHVNVGDQLFISVICFSSTGGDCTELALIQKNIYFRIEAESATVAEEFNFHQKQYIGLRDDGYSRAMTFKTKDEEGVMFRIYPLANKNTNKLDINCGTVQLNVYLCIGTVPDMRIIGNVDTSPACENLNVTKLTDGGFVEFDLDSSKANVAAGNIFVVFKPDYSKVVGDTKFASDCHSEYRFYKNHQISHFQKTYKQTVFAGTTYQNGLHLMADVPTITQMQASTDSYGDRFVLQYSSDQPVFVCITDDEEFYPIPTETSDGTCTLFYSKVATAIEERAINFKNFMNRRGVGQIRSTTRIYMTVWAGAGGAVGQGFFFNVSITPQAYLKHDMSVGLYFTPRNMFGNDEFISVAFDIRGLTKSQQANATLVSGPECNNEKCRLNPPRDFFEKTIVTYVSPTAMIPNAKAFFMRNNEKGVQTLSFFDMLDKEPRNFEQIYVSMQYRLAAQINENKTVSSMPYSLYLIQNYSKSAVLSYQATRSVTKDFINVDPIDHFQSVLPYDPSEVIIFPCKGKPTLLVDAMSPKSTPMLRDYQELVPGDWGKPLVKRFVKDNRKNVNMFLSVFDEALYNYEKEEFDSNVSQMEYEIFVGSQSEVNTPGNQGQLTIVNFDPSGDGKVKLRFTPAREPNQHGNLSSVDYRLYVIPYLGSPDPEKDYSPYTACGVLRQGYPVYMDDLGMERIHYDVDKTIKDGYIEIETNQKLWQGDEVSKGHVLYITVLVGKVSYTGVLVGNDSMSLASLMSISMTITVIIAASLFLAFWALFVRVKSIKAQGYKAVIA